MMVIKPCFRNAMWQDIVVLLIEVYTFDIQIEL
jgi:hypothetical protein